MNHWYLWYLLCGLVSLALEEYFFGVDNHITSELGIDEENVPPCRVIYCLTILLVGPLSLILTLWEIAIAYSDDED